MKTEKLYDAISDIREEFIEEAAEYQLEELFVTRKTESLTQRKRITARLIKWGSLAACFCLVLLGAGLMMSGIGAKKGVNDDVSNGMSGPTPTETPGDFLHTVLAYNGALYNVSNELGTLNRAGIDSKITSADCGTPLGNLAKTENGYEPTTKETDIKLYQYANAYSNSAVFVVQDGEEYMAGLFSNTIPIGSSNEYSPVSELFRWYGITSAEHIASVVEVNSVEEGKAVAEKITDTAALEAFYNAVMSMEDLCYGRYDFEKTVMDKMSEEEQKIFQASERAVCIETAEGLKFYLNWYPQWFYSAGARACYQVTEEMQHWLEQYIE